MRLPPSLPPLLLLAAMGVGCADPPVPIEPTRPPPTQGPPSEFVRLTPADCRVWADNFANRVDEATRRRIDECDQKLVAAGASPMASSATDLEVTDAEANRLRDLIIDQCSEQAGARYPRADAACYLGKKRLEDWKDCHFRSTFFADYKFVAHNHENMFRERCQTALEQLSQ